ncbi:MAG: hypothetical protein M3347_10015, partial [Armatimonadota bacterium]|nr:hypothetical protein [Armatimonadota bacterium]
QSTFYDGSEVMVSALAVDKAGNVYAGVSPGGTVYRFSPDGKRTTIFDSDQTFVWDLEWDEAGRLLIATGGTAGKLYRLLNPATPSLVADQADTRSPASPAVAELSLLATVPQKHVRAISARGTEIFIGTADEGVLYRIDSTNGATTALCQPEGRGAADSEVQAVAAAPEGVYFGLSNSGTIYRWDQTNGVVTMYPSPQQAIYALQRAPDGRLYAATGDKGVVYQLQPGANENDTFVARILEPTQLQALALTLTPSGNVLIGTGNNGAAFQLTTRDTASGTFTSSVHDAKNVAQWGALRMIGRDVVLEARSGNTSEPDASWSEWKTVQPNELGELRITAPAARYLQYRARFSKTDASPGAWTVAASKDPGLSRVEVVYRTKNSAPSVGLTAPQGGDYWRAKKRIAWSGKDPDSDSLRYRLWLSSDDGKSWKPIEMEDDDNSSFEMDTTKWPDGAYRVKVEASDALRNPDDPLRDESISLPFTIDNTAPRFESQSLSPASEASAKLRLQAVVRDELSPITGAEWRVVEPKTEKTGKEAAETKSSSGTSSSTGSDKTSDKPGEKSSEKTEKADTKPGEKSEKSEKSDTKSDSSPITAITPATSSKKSAPKDQDDKWQAVAAADGIFDSRRESLTALITLPPAVSASATSASAPSAATTTGAQQKGNRKIEVRVHDAAGNTTTVEIALP